MLVAELKERHVAATETVNALREQLKHRRLLLLDTDVAGYARSQGKTPVSLGPTDLVCCRTLQGHTGKLNSPTDKDGNLPVARMLSGHKGYISCCQYVPDEDTHLITSSGDHTCILWDITTGLRTSVFGGEFQSGHTSDVLSVSISGSNSRMFVSGSCDGTARLWDTRVASRAVRTFHGHEADVNAVKFFPDGNRFGTGSDDGTCRLFDIRTGHQLQVYYQQRGDNDVPPVNSIAFSISGRLLFAGYSNGDCYVWDTLLAEVVLNLGSLQNSHEARISCLGLSADGSALCTGSWDTNLKASGLSSWHLNVHRSYPGITFPGGWFAKRQERREGGVAVGVDLVMIRWAVADFGMIGSSGCGGLGVGFGSGDELGRVDHVLKDGTGGGYRDESARVCARLPAIFGYSVEEEFGAEE
ncbi:GTP binding protein beta 1 [Actinidia rufa]|uniref:GTP binding protein beta 1 n=1 Tax=Actinidia rufa TaxID=165716 RepID=A0A7J0F8S8_9ERIC|nr:GTP binding protein beta 1 [Actinidia rufa]